MAQTAAPLNLEAKTRQKKLARLPPNARVSKRPLFRTAIPSPYTNTKEQKIVYVSAKTPFLSAVKRVEKLLDLADKRLVQSATTLSQQHRLGKSTGRGKRKRDAAGADEDEILDIAETVERQKRVKTGDGKEGGVGEEVVIKGTGKAINKVLELGLWFQQREDQYAVKLRTDSVAAIDDINIDEGDERGDEPVGEEMDAEVGVKAESMSVNVPGGTEAADQKGKVKKKRRKEASTEPVSETRIRYTSMLEVAVTLR